jgi:hypothetical protein
MVVAAPRGEFRQRSKRIAKAFKPIVVVFAALYFLIDAIFFSLKAHIATPIWQLRRPTHR